MAERRREGGKLGCALHCTFAEGRAGGMSRNCSGVVTKCRLPGGLPRTGTGRMRKAGTSQPCHRYLWGWQRGREETGRRSLPAPCPPHAILSQAQASEECPTSLSRLGLFLQFSGSCTPEVATGQPPRPPFEGRVSSGKDRRRSHNHPSHLPLRAGEREACRSKLTL